MAVASDLDDSELLLINSNLRKHFTDKGSALKSVHWILHGLSLLIILTLVAFASWTAGVSRTKCWDMFNYYSPVNDAVVPNDYVPRQFNGSLWYESGFKGPPTPEVEANWYQIMKYGLISVSKDDIRKVQHENWSAEFPPEVGGGYIAATIGTHQLHCLHYIWQDHYIDYVEVMQEKKKRVPEMYERHYEHCVDYIRQSLMCQFDTGIIPYNWVLDHNNPTPNSNTHHKCVNWDRLQDWLETRAVEMPDGFKWKQPADAKTLDYNP